MHVVKPIIVECKNCLHLIAINDVDLDAVGSYERNMGSEKEYAGELNFCCEECEAEIYIQVSVWEYPVGAVNYVSIKSDDVSVIENPVFSSYDYNENIED